MAASLDPAKIDLVKELVKADGGWAVLPTARPDGTIQSSIVTATFMSHPLTGEPSVAFLCRGETVKIRNMRRHPRATITFRGGSRWVTVEGQLSLIGPDDPADGFNPADLPDMLRSIQVALRGGHDDWATFDQNMREQRRAGAFISLDRVYTNPGR